MRILKLHTELKISILISILVSLSPTLLLIEHHAPNDIVDKVILFLTAFITTFFNIRFQNWIQPKVKSIGLIIFYTLLLNIVLFGFDILLRFPLWNSFTTDKPLLIILVLVEWIRNLIIGFVAFFLVRYLIKNEKEKENQLKFQAIENENLQLQLNALTAQLQPHFFFNNLNVLAELIQVDTEKSEEYIQNLSKFFRYILSIQQNPLINLSDEIEFIQTYIYLLKIRFGDGIKITYLLDKMNYYSIPSLSTLIIMENIVKHNVIQSVHIDFTLDEIDSVLKIKNTIHHKNNLPNEKLGYGLENINKKCKLLLNKNIQVAKNKEYFEVEIPIKKN